ncbi:MAG: competence/damage-inducible protein A [Saprospiraceae bacterium]|nr:competence/damage-inducible protein A [Saprospiraceae bacterium]
MNAQIITIGDEILIGQIVDTNSAWMAQQLNANGIAVTEIITCRDDKESILSAVKRALSQGDLVLTTGGLGPTKDDITKKTLADYFGFPMAFHQPTFEIIEQLITNHGRKLTEAHRNQAWMPEGIQHLENKMGTAPGMWFEQDGKVLISMPGVPYEMKYIVENQAIPAILKRFKTTPIRHRTILTVGQGESKIAEIIEDFENSLAKDNIKLAYLPSLGSVRLRLSVSGENAAILDDLLDAKVEELKTLIPQYIYGFGTTTFEAALGELLKSKGVTVSTAESCTGGLVAHRLTTVSGSSAYFHGSVVAYDNAIKRNVLGVKSETLDKFGAVSEETVTEMVQGVLKVMKTDYAIAVSGIAGPTGGKPDKPVGTIWVAVGNKDEVRTHKLQLSKDRMKNVEYTVVFALNFLRKMVNRK